MNVRSTISFSDLVFIIDYYLQDSPSTIVEKIGSLGLCFFIQQTQSGLCENHKSGFSICLTYEKSLEAYYCPLSIFG